MQHIPYLVKERDFGIGVVSPDHQNDHMQQYQCIEQGCEGKLFIGKYEQYKANEGGKYFQKPNKCIFGVYD